MRLSLTSFQMARKDEVIRGPCLHYDIENLQLEATPFYHKCFHDGDFVFVVLLTPRVPDFFPARGQKWPKMAKNENLNCETILNVLNIKMGAYIKMEPLQAYVRQF